MLGVSCDYHDAAAAIVVDGLVVAAAEEERFSRVKHDRSVPARAIESSLAVAGLEPDDVDVIAFYEKPLSVLARYLASRQRQGPRSLRSFVRDTPSFVGRNLLVGYRIDRELQRLGRSRPTEISYLEHHRSHAAAAFFPSPFRHAAILTVDGIGEWATATIGLGANHRIDVLEEMRYPNSFGLVYSFVTAYCGFEANDGEYKLMGLAPYGTPRFADQLGELLTVNDDGSITVDAKRLGWYGPAGLRRGSIHRLFDGPPRHPDGEISQREADLAASVQQVLETALMATAHRAAELTGESRLCLAGGVALNCVANGKILREGPFDEVWVQPAAGDAGSAIGAALSVWHEEWGNPRRVDGVHDGMSGSFLGPAATVPEVDRWVQERGIVHRSVPDPEELARVVAQRLVEGAVVGWFGGRMEFGPRALGHRSILADPRSETVREHVNASVKGRESFRPFAPMVLEERAAEWFDLDAPSPYMLIVAPVAASRRRDVAVEPPSLAERARVPRSDIPACTHVDGSARVQTVGVGTNPDMHRLLSAFDELTGCPVLLNTSFNVAGEPIVAGPDDAVATALAAGLDLLVIEHCLIEVADLVDAATVVGALRAT